MRTWVVGFETVEMGPWLSSGGTAQRGQRPRARGLVAHEHPTHQSLRRLSVSPSIGELRRSLDDPMTRTFWETER